MDMVLDKLRFSIKNTPITRVGGQSSQSDTEKIVDELRRSLVVSDSEDLTNALRKSLTESTVFCR
ncbi:MAG: hypothetical protein ACYDH2_07075 [Anaerolineaceae bacterium]